MGTALKIREDLSADALRRAARRERDGRAAARLYAIANALDGMSRAEAARLAGSDFFCGLTFPVAASHCSLILGGWGGTTVGLSSLDGADASQNETTSERRFEDRRWYRVRVAVTTTHIRAWLDDEPIADVATAGKRIGTRPEVEASRPLGIAAYRTRAGLRDIRLRAL